MIWKQEAMVQEDRDTRKNMNKKRKTDSFLSSLHRMRYHWYT